MNVLSLEKEAAYIHLTIEMLEGTGTITLHSKLDGDVQNEDSNYEEHFGKKELLKHKKHLALLQLRPFLTTLK